MELTGESLKKYFTKCVRCDEKEGFRVKPEDSRRIYVGMGNYFCVDCFARVFSYQSEKICIALEKARNKTWLCMHCKKKYKSKYSLQDICDKCSKQSWACVRNLDGKMEVRNWNAFLKKLDENEKRIKRS